MKPRQPPTIDAPPVTKRWCAGQATTASPGGVHSRDTRGLAATLWKPPAQITSPKSGAVRCCSRVRSTRMSGRRRSCSSIAADAAARAHAPRPGERVTQRDRASRRWRGSSRARPHVLGHPLPQSSSCALRPPRDRRRIPSNVDPQTRPPVSERTREDRTTVGRVFEAAPSRRRDGITDDRGRTQ